MDPTHMLMAPHILLQPMFQTSSLKLL